MRLLPRPPPPRCRRPPSDRIGSRHAARPHGWRRPPFNLGEATVTRAAIVLADGRTDFAYQLGRDRQKARAAAIVDALWQGEERAAIERALAPVRQRIADAATQAARRTAATRVNFFTMVRGED